MNQQLVPGLLPVVSEEGASGNIGQSRIFATIARCRISVGDPCTVYFPDHHDAASYRDHLDYHEQNAIVHAVHKDEVDLKMTTGCKTGQICEKVNPMNLFFWGSYIKE